MRDIILEKSTELDETNFYKWLDEYVDENKILYTSLNQIWSQCGDRYLIYYLPKHIVDDNNLDKSIYLLQRLLKYSVLSKKKSSDESDKKFKDYTHKLSKEIQPEGGMLYIENKGLFKDTFFQYFTLDEINNIKHK